LKRGLSGGDKLRLCGCPGLRDCERMGCPVLDRVAWWHLRSEKRERVDAMLVTPSASTIKSWQDSLAKNGSRSITIEKLIGYYNVGRRGTRVVEQILTHLKELEPPIYAPELADTTLPLAKVIKLCRLDPGPGGKTYATALRHERRGDEDKNSSRAAEQKFKKDHLDELLDHLGLREARLLNASAREFSPHGTRDRLDVLCEGENGDLVALEIKLQDGERRGVEQLLRYTQQLANSKSDDPRLERYRTAAVRTILVTGVRDQATFEAIATLDPYEIVDWYRYAMDKTSRVLEGVEKCEVPRHPPSNPLTVDKAPEVGVSRQGKSVTVELRAFQAELSLAAAKKLYEQLGKALGRR
jgi:hypothetical protein